MFFVTELDKAQMEFVKKLDYYQPDDRLDEDVTRLAEWMSKQPHLPVVTDRKWLSHFIVGCKYNLHKAKKIIDKYFVTRAEHPEFVCSLDRKQFIASFNYGKVFMIPKLTPEAHRVLFIVAQTPLDNSKFDFFNYCQIILNTLELHMRDEPTRGVIFVLDIKLLPLSAFLAISPTVLRNSIKLSINSFPLIVKSINYINSPLFIGQVISMSKMFLSNKIYNRIHVHDTLETLYEFVPKDILPDQYGGTAGDIKKIQGDWFDYFMANNEWFDNRPKADLSKRVGQTKVENFGVEGTFKQLQID